LNIARNVWVSTRQTSEGVPPSIVRYIHFAPMTPLGILVRMAYVAISGSGVDEKTFHDITYG